VGRERNRARSWKKKMSAVEERAKDKGIQSDQL
jgi:hypothetical protein